MGRQTDQESDNVSSDCQNEHDCATIERESDEKKYKCTYSQCHAVFSRPSRLKRHIRSHTGERPYNCDHPGCTKSYTNSSHLKRHLQTHSAVKKMYKCSHCPQNFSNIHNLKRHYKHIHSDNNKLMCKNCNITFNKRQQLAKHEAEHIGSIPYKCDKCAKSFINLTKFKRHKKVHERGNKSYPCPHSECSQVFDKWLQLCAHRKSSHVTEYNCNICDKKFLRKSRLKTHLIIHSEKRMVLPCTYDKCQKIYFFKSNLEEHVKTKHLGKKFYCDLCSAGLISKQKLIEHIQRHSKSKEIKLLNKVQRKTRKDAGVLKKSMLSGLIGINLPNNLEKMVMNRQVTINIEPLEASTNVENNINCIS